MLSKELEKLNLKDKEIKVYLALLELGEANMQRICDKSKIKRTTAYEIFKSLKEKGLISSIKKNKKTFYYAENPRKIGEIINEKMLTFKKILPQLLSITNSIDKKPTIRFYEGRGGIEEVFRNTLKFPNTEILAWASFETIKYFNDSSFLDHFVDKRLKNKIWVRAITPDDKNMEKYKLESYDFLRKMKLIPKDNYPLEAEICLYGTSSIAIMSFKEEIGVIIDSKVIMNTLKSIFEMNWAMFK